MNTNQLLNALQAIAVGTSEASVKIQRDNLPALIATLHEIATKAINTDQPQYFDNKNNTATN